MTYNTYIMYRKEIRKGNIDMALSEAQYRALDKTHCYASMLKTLHTSSAKHLDIRKESESMAFGTLAHLYFLEPDKFASTVVVVPEFKPETKEDIEKYAESCVNGVVGEVKRGWTNTTHCKEMKTAFEASVGSKSVISITDMTRLEKMMESTLETYPTMFNKLMRGGEAEVSVVMDRMPHKYGETEFFVPGKARFDYMKEFGGDIVVADLKTCQSSHPKAFKHDSIKWGYDIQGAWYSDLGMAKFGKPVKFVFLAVETQPPFNAVFYDMSEEMYNYGKTKYANVLEEAVDIINGKEKLGYTQKDKVLSL